MSEEKNGAVVVGTVALLCRECLCLYMLMNREFNISLYVECLIVL